MATAQSGLISDTISNLIGGVSQQADSLRAPTQAEEIINALLSPTEGLIKRPPTNYLQNLSSIFSAFKNLAPYQVLTQAATASLPQITDIITAQSPIDPAGTVYRLQFWYNPLIFSDIYYTVSAVDTAASIATNFAAAVNAQLNASFDVTASNFTGNILRLTGDFNFIQFRLMVVSRSFDNVVLPSGGVFTHIYDRDQTEKYEICIVNGDLKVFNLINGVEKTVTFPDGKAYLVAEPPGQQFRAVTVGDYTFIANRTFTVDDLTTTSPVVVREALVWVKIGDYGVDYSVKLDGTEYKFSTDTFNRDEVNTEFVAKGLMAKIPHGQSVLLGFLDDGYVVGETITLTETSPGSAVYVYTVKEDNGAVEDIHSIAKGLCDVINHGALATTNHIYALPVTNDPVWGISNGFIVAGIAATDDYLFNISTDSAEATPSRTNSAPANTWVVTRNGSTLYIKKVSAADFTVASYDGLGDEGIRTFKGQIQRFNDLPARGVDGFRIEVTGEERTLNDNYHVIYKDSLSVVGDGVWKESLKADERISLDPATMPHVLIRASDGTFTFGKATWDSRLVGDLTTAPFPSFLDKKISDIFFYKNRLAFVAEENVVCTSVGDYFNFFRKSVMQLIDEDVIDISVAATEVAMIRHAVPHESGEILWANKQQFAFDGSPLLTPKSVAAPPVSAFDNSERVKPVRVGKDIFFCADRGSATQLMEFYLTPDGKSNDADDVTEICPSYMVGKPLQVAGSDTLKIVVVATIENTTDLYIHNYLYSGEQMLQSAISTWRFNGSIQSAEVLENRIYLIIQRGAIVTLEIVEVLPNNKDDFSTFLSRLDLKMTEDTFGMSSAFSGGRTTWTLPFAIPVNDSYPLKVIRRPSASSALTTELSSILRPAENQISVSGDHTTTDVFIGLQYDFSYEFSKIYKREQGPSGQSIALSEVITKLRLLALKYDKTGYFTVEVTPTGRSTPYTYTFDGDTDLESGVKVIPIQADNEQVTIVIKSSSHRPCAFQGASWTGFISQTTRRV